MDKRVILAVAGAGKTYYLCHQIDPAKKNLILAYTHENIHNIKKELIAAYGKFPTLTNVMTFDSFIYRYIICPYEPTILQHFNCNFDRTKGITTVDPPPRQITKNGKTFANPKYVSQDKIEHYLSPQKQYYCANLSELIMHVKNGKDSLVKRVAQTLNLFYDKVLIDEFQDFREYDFDLITLLAKFLKSCLLVGDYYQHSVSAVNNTGRPYKKGKNDVSYSEFVLSMEKSKFAVDTTSLQKSRRCPEAICLFVKEKLKITIESEKINVGSVFWVNDNYKEILNSNDIVKLVYNNSSHYSFPAINWSYSKGDTLNDVCVILTDDFEKMDEPDFSIDSNSISTINKLYVALTRTRGNLYILKNSIFKKHKKEYLKQ